MTEELYDLILFTVHSFVRPMTTELYALKHNDVSIQERTDDLLTFKRGALRRGDWQHRPPDNSLEGRIGATLLDGMRRWLGWRAGDDCKTISTLIS